MSFARIKDIDVGKAATWEEPLFLTFDIDWASDDVLNYTIDIVEQYGTAATWFVTHDTPVLERLRRNPAFELGIHPNFNFLLNGDPRKGATAGEVIDRMLDFVPEAKSVRSHSMTQNSNILELFVEKSLTHDSNHFIPEQTGMVLKPWNVWNDLIKVPYFWEDDVVCIYEQNTPLKDLVKRNGVKVFDFHPIHVFLNTEKLDRYETTRSLHQDTAKLKEHVFNGYGARSRLEELLTLGRGQ